jgi:CheY-like chemotaxis protein
MIRRNVDLEARLIEDLLDLTRINRGVLIMRREVVDAHEQVLRVIEICGDELEAAGLTMISRLAARAHHIDADPARLQQVMWNLLKNAIKFSPTGGKVIIRTRNLDPPEGEDRPRLVIEVIDRGIGINAEALPRIFNMFEQGCPTTGQKFGGLGVGLAISKSIVEHHGGRMAAASAGPGQGTTLSIELPTVAAPVEVPAVSPPARRVEPAQAHKILLVEDNKDTLRYLSAMLHRRGHSVRTAANVAAAVREAAEAHVDLLISDIELPDGTGLELMRTLSGMSPVKGIALSGYGTSDDIDQSRSAGFSEHLIKPVEFRRLEQAIQQVMAGTEAER